MMAVSSEKVGKGIQAHIVLGFLALLVLLAGASYLWWAQAKSQEQKMKMIVSDVTEETNHKINLVQGMRGAILKRIISLQRAFIDTDPFYRDEQNLEFINHAGLYMGYRAKLLQMELTDAEQVLLDTITSTIQHSQPKTEEAMSRVIDGDSVEDFLEIAKEAEQGQLKLVGHLDALIELERRYASEKLVQLRYESEQSGKLLSVGTISIVLLSLVVASILGRIILRRNYETMELAHKDSLTGLVNRAVFKRVLLEAVESVKAGGEKHVLMYLDLDKFKVVNDTCGHQAGDELLNLIARRWQDEIRDKDLLARLGGDEFTLLLTGASKTAARRVASKLVAVTEGLDYECSGQTFDLGVSIGVIVVDRHADTADRVLARADEACYKAKSSLVTSVMFV